MSLFQCEKCGARENTALAQNWLDDGEICSECRTGQWHGVFEFSYDYYEWTSLVCVSSEPQKLKDYWMSEGDGVPFANDEKEHRSFAKNEETHYKIQPIKCV